jgi:hypothetical protein
VLGKLAIVITSGNGGLFTPNGMWSAIVDCQGVLCSVINSGNDPWPGSRDIAIAKATTANGFSNSAFALSTANLPGRTCPAGTRQLSYGPIMQTATGHGASHLARHADRVSAGPELIAEPPTLGSRLPMLAIMSRGFAAVIFACAADPSTRAGACNAGSCALGMSSRSNAAKMPKTSLPAAVVVSIAAPW